MSAVKTDTEMYSLRGIRFERAPTEYWEVRLTPKGATDGALLARYFRSQTTIASPRWYSARDAAMTALACGPDDILVVPVGGEK